MRRLAGGFGLGLQRHQYSFFFWNVRNRSRTFDPGEWSFSAKAQNGFKEFAEKFKGYSQTDLRHLDKFDWWTCLRKMGFKHEELVQRDLMDSTDFGESIRLTSAYTAATEYLGGNVTDEMDSKIVGGNSRLIHALAASIGRASVHTDAEVKQIRQRDEKVKAILANGEEFTADVCICTVPGDA